VTRALRLLAPLADRPLLSHLLALLVVLVVGYTVLPEHPLGRLASPTLPLRLVRVMLTAIVLSESLLLAATLARLYTVGSECTTSLAAAHPHLRDLPRTWGRLWKTAPWAVLRAAGPLEVLLLLLAVALLTAAVALQRMTWDVLACT
jgi:hypothetical protein